MGLGLWWMCAWPSSSLKLWPRLVFVWWRLRKKNVLTVCIMIILKIKLASLESLVSMLQVFFVPALCLIIHFWYYASGWNVSFNCLSNLHSNVQAGASDIEQELGLACLWLVDTQSWKNLACSAREQECLGKSWRKKSMSSAPVESTWHILRLSTLRRNLESYTVEVTEVQNVGSCHPES